MKQFIKIVQFGLIGEAQNGDSFRHVIFKDTTSNKEAEYIVYKRKRPALWEDIEALEKGRVIPPYAGYVTRFNGVNVVVFGGESIEEAFRNQKWKLNIQKSISYTKAEKMRLESNGYCTNETRPGTMEISWREIASDTKMVRFRYYEGSGNFAWSNWYEIK